MKCEIICFWNSYLDFNLSLETEHVVLLVRFDLNEFLISLRALRVLFFRHDAAAFLYLDLILDYGLYHLVFIANF